MKGRLKHVGGEGVDLLPFVLLALEVLGDQEDLAHADADHYEHLEDRHLGLAAGSGGCEVEVLLLHVPLPLYVPRYRLQLIHEEVEVFGKAVKGVDVGRILVQGRVPLEAHVELFGLAVGFLPAEVDVLAIGDRADGHERTPQLLPASDDLATLPGLEIHLLWLNARDEVVDLQGGPLVGRHLEAVPILILEQYLDARDALPSHQNGHSSNHDAMRPFLATFLLPTCLLVIALCANN
eukprot:CAMPEP_0168626024 /NCGR_PEP_ID=MMETSP0449_2-20121227/10384_1 /TAXON_ID=1082188 /ORGANISM="Strombidium rassoulzadegani, Strain ras09" /LENGTH=236 /DNA_ID=CAMNT_0008667937 /DNA_START=30 /DNA_END=739 /DNA_ORIENTATION=-